MNQFIIATFYKFVSLPDYEALKQPLLDVMNKHHVLGSIIMASEGLNGTISGKPEDIAHVYAYFKSDARLADIQFKEARGHFIPFEKAKVKLRKEIVTLGIDDVDPRQDVGTYVTPEAWNELISDPDVCVVDTRNEYEYQIGTFKHAENPHTENFRDFPAYVQAHLMDKKDKKIAMFCTGGIRCEKSTAYLKKLGFEQVYHLKGGILNYLDSIPVEESLWQGDCFVFDDRITVGQPRKD